MEKAIIGYGGFAKEVSSSIRSSEKYKIKTFFIDDEYYNGLKNTKPLSEFDPKKYKVIIAIGDGEVRKKILNNLPKNTKFFTHIHKSVQMLDDSIEIGEGSIICAGSILTTNIKLGNHSQLNLHSTIGHDCVIGDFFTTAPGVKISGNCHIGNMVYFGTNSSSKEKIKICDEVVVGLNAGVVNDITERGVYIGTPTKKIK